MNRITIMGNLGRAPELRKTKNDKSVCSFSVATTEKYNGESQTQWHNVTFWGKQAEIIAQYFTKGSKILLTGKMTYRSYESDGVTKYSADIMGLEFHFVDSKNSGGNTSQEPQQPQGLPVEDDLPF